MQGKLQGFVYIDDIIIMIILQWHSPLLNFRDHRIGAPLRDAADDSAIYRHDRIVPLRKRLKSCLQTLGNFDRVSWLTRFYE